MRGRAFVVLVGLAAIAAVALIGGAVFKGGSHSAARYSKFSLTDPDSQAQTPGLGPGMTWDTYLQAADAYPASERAPPDDVANAEATFDAIAASRREERRPEGQGTSGSSSARQEDATQPGVTRLLRRDEQHGEPHHRARRLARLRQPKELPRLGRCRRRRRLAHRQRDRERSRLEAAAGRPARPELGRRR